MWNKLKKTGSEGFPCCFVETKQNELEAEEDILMVDFSTSGDPEGLKLRFYFGDEEFVLKSLDWTLD